MKNLPRMVMKPVTAIRKWRAAPVVSVLRLQGVIAPGGSAMRRGNLNLASLERRIAQAFRPKRLGAVVLIINSPGGSPVQSDLITAAIRARAEERQVPVYAFTEDVAASGGYWLATAADEIYATPASIVGSIGVITAGFGFQGLMDRAGVERRVHTAGERKAFLDPFSPESEEDLERLKKIQELMHEIFINQVKSRRGDRLNRRRYKDIFSGDMFLGEEAERLGLIDGIGTASAFIREKFGKDARVRRIDQKSSPLRNLFGGGATAAGGEAIGTGIAAEMMASLDERAQWGRFGL